MGSSHLMTRGGTHILIDFQQNSSIQEKHLLWHHSGVITILGGMETYDLLPYIIVIN